MLTLACCQDHILTEIYSLYARKHHIVEMRGGVTDAGRTNKQIELLSQWKLEAEFRNIYHMAERIHISGQSCSNCSQQTRGSNLYFRHSPEALSSVTLSHELTPKLKEERIMFQESPTIFEM